MYEHLLDFWATMITRTVVTSLYWREKCINLWKLDECERIGIGSIFSMSKACTLNKFIFLPARHHLITKIIQTFSKLQDVIQCDFYKQNIFEPNGCNHE